MIGLPYIFRIRIDFLFFVVLFIAIVFSVLQKFKLSKIKIFLIIVFILVAVPIAWFFIVVDSGTAQRIYHKITIANHCEIDSDCTIAYYGSSGLFCGSYVNKNEDISSIYKDIKFWRLLSFEDYFNNNCANISVTKPVCKNKWCIESSEY